MLLTEAGTTKSYGGNGLEIACSKVLANPSAGGAVTERGRSSCASVSSPVIRRTLSFGKRRVKDSSDLIPQSPLAPLPDVTPSAKVPTTASPRPLTASGVLHPLKIQVKSRERGSLGTFEC